jgi:N6-adenosine-specific RNA methylase IME4
MAELARYEAAKQALAEAARIDEVKDWLDKAAAMREYARRAKDCDLIDNATEIKLRAERRAGDLLKEMAQSGERDLGKGGDRRSRLHGATVKLVDLGVMKTQSSRWQKLADLPEQMFEERVAHAKRQAIASLDRTAKSRSAEKNEQREEREAELAKEIQSLPEKRYGVIYADPFGTFAPVSWKIGFDRAAEKHHRVARLKDILALGVPSIAADDCVLFLWTPPSKLADALEVMKTLGFEYRSHAVWVTDQAETGPWFRNQHELLLVGVKGEISKPLPESRWSSVVEAPVGPDRQKPEIFYRLIEGYFSHLPKFELHAAGRREGWDRFGDEAPPLETALDQLPADDDSAAIGD